MIDLIKVFFIISLCIYIYKKFIWKPKIKIVQVPTPEDIKRQNKKDRRIRKIKRHFKIPYWGKTQISEFDKTKPYIESAWNEIEHSRKSK